MIGGKFGKKNLNQKNQRKLIEKKRKMSEQNVIADERNKGNFNRRGFGRENKILQNEKRRKSF